MKEKDIRPSDLVAKYRQLSLEDAKNAFLKIIEESYRALPVEKIIKLMNLQNKIFHMQVAIYVKLYTKSQDQI